LRDIDLVGKGKALFSELTRVVESLSDEEIQSLFDSGEIENLLKAVLDPTTVKNYKNYAEFFLANKHRAWFLAGLRALITHAYSFKRKSHKGVEGYVSPMHVQWYEDGVMLLEGKQRFEGFIALYRSGKILHAIAARDIKPHEELEPDDVVFVELDEYLKVRNSGLLPEDSDLDAPVNKLRQLLDNVVEAESEYQQLLENYPWILGMQYRRFDRQTILDDKNIPDFTGVRASDGCRDVFEIKSPFLPLTTKKGTWNVNFHNSWQQAEDRLDFVERNRDYLYNEKGLNFENPRCHLMLGYHLDAKTTSQLYKKARQNPKIVVSTYDSLLSYARNTVGMIRKLQADLDKDHS